MKGYRYDAGERPANTTPDGLTWLDPSGNPPELDGAGRLLADFTLVRDDGTRERWVAGQRLSPYTRRQWQAVEAALTSKRAANPGRRISHAEEQQVVKDTLRELRKTGAVATLTPSGRTGTANPEQETDQDMSKYDSMSAADIQVTINAALANGKRPSGAVYTALKAAQAREAATAPTSRPDPVVQQIVEKMYGSDEDTEPESPDQPGGALNQPVAVTVSADASGAAEAIEEAKAGLDRLANGQLPVIVLNHLREHPDQEFTPSALGKALARSSGAIFKACRRLVDDGAAIQTSEEPRRYRFA